MKKWFEQIEKPIIGLSPMAGVTDYPFRELVKDFGVDVIFNEFVSSEALIRDNVKTFEMLKISKRQRPVICQIFGADPTIMANAAQIIENKIKPDGVDINFGCSVPKAKRGGYGAVLMQEPQTAYAIASAVKKAVSIPVSAKMRLGWSNKAEAVDFAKGLEQAGIDLLTVHGRTFCQSYETPADWVSIYKVKQSVSIPVLGNGDLDSHNSWNRLVPGKVDGGLIGRAALGNPWLFAEIKGQIKEPPNFADRLPTVIKHLQLSIDHYGIKTGVNSWRKHLIGYLKSQPQAKQLRVELLTESDPRVIITKLNLFAGLS